MTLSESARESVQVVRQAFLATVASVRFWWLPGLIYAAFVIAKEFAWRAVASGELDWHKAAYVWLGYGFLSQQDVQSIVIMGCFAVPFCLATWFLWLAGWRAVAGRDAPLPPGLPVKLLITVIKLIVIGVLVIVAAFLALVILSFVLLAILGMVFGDSTDVIVRSLPSQLFMLFVIWFGACLFQSFLFLTFPALLAGDDAPVGRSTDVWTIRPVTVFLVSLIWSLGVSGLLGLGLLSYVPSDLAVLSAGLPMGGILAFGIVMTGAASTLLWQLPRQPDALSGEDEAKVLADWGVNITGPDGQGSPASPARPT
jgi:hypothetical protein